MVKPNNIEIHKEFVDNTARKLIENEVSTRAGPGHGIDLILDSEKGIKITGYNDHPAAILTTRPLDQLKAEYLIIATDQRLTYGKKFYVMTMDEAKEKAVTDLDGKDNWYIEPSVYREYINNYDILV